MALLALAPALVVLVVLMVAFIGVTVDSTRWTQRRVDLFEARTAASTATQLAVEEIWTDWEEATAGLEVRIGTFRQFLDNYGIPDKGGDPAPAGVEILPRLALPVDGQGESNLDGAVIESVRVFRFDEPRRTRVEFETTATLRRGNGGATSAESRRTIQDVFVVEPPPFAGLDYALLANNINCIMCHTTIDNVDRVYNVDPSARGSFERVKAGSIESFQFRSNPESFIAGSLYLGGGALDEHGEHISDWAGLSLDAFEVDALGNIAEDVTGGTTVVDLVPADPDDPLAGANLYVDYFGHEGDEDRYQVDGVLPSEFPAPFSDDGGYDPTTLVETPEGGGNRVVDDNEFWSTVAGLEGSAQGGRISVVPFGSTVTTSAELTSLESGSASLGSVTDGNVFMHGTESDPVVIDGDMAIAGDLIISGYVKGAGDLSVRGNVYVVGDLQYLDREVSGSRDYGVNEEGGQNLLSLASGKNILVGDFYDPAFNDATPANGLSDGSWNFAMDEIAIFNRMEWMRTQPTLPGEPYLEVTGYDEVQHELFQTVTVQEEQAVHAWVETGDMLEVPVYESQQTGTQVVPVYENQQVGTEVVPVYETIHHPATEYQPAWNETVQTGTQTVPVYESVQVGTETVPVYENVQVGVDLVPETEWVQTGTVVVDVVQQVSFDPPQFETEMVPIEEWVTPQHDNIHYRGPDYMPRYYAFGEGTPVPIFNQVGHYDPLKELWIAPERAASWDESAVTFADPTDPTDPSLFGADGSPLAAVTTLTPTNGWITDDLLRDLIGSRLADREVDDPLAVDAWLYSSNSVFGIVPDEPEHGTSGLMRVNGAVIAADVGLLATNGMSINYDERGQENLAVTSTTELVIRRQLWAPGSSERQVAPVATLE